MNYLQCFCGLVFLVVLCIKSGNAISCYDCNSATDKRCLGDDNNQLSDDLKKQCPERTREGRPFILCRKIKQVIDFEVNGLQPDTRIIRTCGYENSTHSNRCYQRSGFGGRQEVCGCTNEDFCNSSPKVLVSVPLLVALVALLKFYV